jgi:hypothetical protein
MAGRIVNLLCGVGLVVGLVVVAAAWFGVIQ